MLGGIREMPNVDEFITKVLEPFGRRFSASEPFRPVKIRLAPCCFWSVAVWRSGAPSLKYISLNRSTSEP